MTKVMVQDKSQIYIGRQYWFNAVTNKRGSIVFETEHHWTHDIEEVDGLMYCIEDECSRYNQAVEFVDTEARAEDEAEARWKEARYE